MFKEKLITLQNWLSALEGMDDPAGELMNSFEMRIRELERTVVRLENRSSVLPEPQERLRDLQEP